MPRFPRSRTHKVPCSALSERRRDKSTGAFHFHICSGSFQKIGRRQQALGTTKHTGQFNQGKIVYIYIYIDIDTTLSPGARPLPLKKKHPVATERGLHRCPFNILRREGNTCPRMCSFLILRRVGQHVCYEPSMKARGKEPRTQKKYRHGFKRC